MKPSRNRRRWTGGRWRLSRHRGRGRPSRWNVSSPGPGSGLPFCPPLLYPSINEVSAASEPQVTSDAMVVHLAGSRMDTCTLSAVRSTPVSCLQSAVRLTPAPHRTPPNLYNLVRAARLEHWQDRRAGCMNPPALRC